MCGPPQKVPRDFIVEAIAALEEAAIARDDTTLRRWMRQAIDMLVLAAQCGQELERATKMQDVPH